MASMACHIIPCHGITMSGHNRAPKQNQHLVNRHHQWLKSWSPLMRRLNGHICRFTVYRVHWTVMMGKTQIGLANIDWISKETPLRGKESAKESFGNQFGTYCQLAKEWQRKSFYCEISISIWFNLFCIVRLLSIHLLQTRWKEATWCNQAALCITFQCIQIQLAECVNNNYSISVVNILPFFSCILKVSIKRTNIFIHSSLIRKVRLTPYIPSLLFIPAGMAWGPPEPTQSLCPLYKVLFGEAQVFF